MDPINTGTKKETLKRGKMNLPVNSQITPGRWGRKYLEEFATCQAKKKIPIVTIVINQDEVNPDLVG